MKIETLEVRATWNGTSWIIRERGETRGGGISAENLVMRAQRPGKDFVEGFIVSVHGLDQEVANRLNSAELRLLGVGAQFRSQRAVAPRRSHTQVYHLGASGSIEIGIV